MTVLLLCRTRQVPTPEQVAEALCQEGYSAFVEVVTGTATSASTEIRYAPNRMPIVIKFRNDLHDAPDEGDYEYREWIEELVPDAETREGIRRFIFIDALENVDQKALQTVVTFVQAQTNSFLGNDKVPD